MRTNIPNLGQILAATKAEEEANTRAAAKRAAEAQSAEELAKFQKVAKFFEDARTFFEQGIVQRRPIKELCIMVGSEYRGRQDNTEVYDILCLYKTSLDDQGRAIPTFFANKKGRYFSLWAEFREWCTSNGLQPRWDYCWDGGGMSSWYHLKIEPATDVA